MSSVPSGKGTVPSLVVPCRAEQSPEAASAAHNLPPIQLRTLPIDEAAALLAGTGAASDGLRWHPDYPMAETLDALGMVTSAHRAVGSAEDREPPWWLHQIVLGDQVVGDVGFHGPPPLGEEIDVEIGYNLVPGLRGRGIATRAVELLLEHAWLDGAGVVRAETDADNAASGRVLLRAGFTALGDHRYVMNRPGTS